ncbi:MAG: Maleylacetoacetate isomerase @ Glutathione S-transferase, zeta, partial [uncultured Acetobacteraceae bacterium]
PWAPCCLANTARSTRKGSCRLCASAIASSPNRRPSLNTWRRRAPNPPCCRPTRSIARRPGPSRSSSRATSIRSTTTGSAITCRSGWAPARTTCSPGIAIGSGWRSLRWKRPWPAGAGTGPSASATSRGGPICTSRRSWRTPGVSAAACRRTRGCSRWTRVAPTWMRSGGPGQRPNPITPGLET